MKTDAEYVERIRKNVRISRWMRWFVIGLALAQAGIGVYALRTTMRIAQDGFLVDPDTYTVGLALGVSFGFAFGILGWSAGTNFVQGILMFSGPRAHRLLVKYFDLYAATEPGKEAEPLATGGST